MILTSARPCYNWWHALSLNASGVIRPPICTNEPGVRLASEATPLVHVVARRALIGWIFLPCTGTRGVLWDKCPPLHVSTQKKQVQNRFRLRSERRAKRITIKLSATSHYSSLFSPHSMAAYYDRHHASITLNEKYFNRSVLHDLSTVKFNSDGYDDSTLIDKDDVSKIIRMIKYTKKNSCNSVTYKKKEYGIGRYYPDPATKNIYGYQNIKSAIRRLVIDGKLKSLDLVNAHVNILNQLCEKYDICHDSVKHYADKENRDVVLGSIMSEYSVDRGVAKKLMLIITFGGSFETWATENEINKNAIPLRVVSDYYNEIQRIMTQFAIEHFPGYTTAVKIAMEVKMKSRKDAFRSALGLYLQDIESQIIMCMYDAICKKEIKVHSLIHDELLIDNCDLDVGELISEIKTKTSFDVLLESKPVTPSESDLKWFDAHKPFFRTAAEKEQRPDDKHANNILSHCEMVRCKSLGVLMYDSQAGLWTNSEDQHMYLVNGLSHEIFPADERDKKPCSFATLYKPAYKLATVMCPIIDNFDVSRSKGYFLFQNGVLDLKNYKMLPKASHYNFLDVIRRDYTIDNYETLEKEILRKLFDMPFVNMEKRDYFIQLLARGICGHVEDRQFLFATGDTACGKTTLTKLIKNTFTNYVTDFNNHHLVAKGGNTESELKWKFIVEFWYKRMAICNEFDMSAEDNGSSDQFGNRIRSVKSIDGTTMKTLVSDGDTITCRALFKDPIKVSNNAFIMVLANDTPSVKPCDAAYLDRANNIHFDRCSSVDCKTPDALYFPRDTSINDFIQNADVCDAFISLLSKYYNKALIPKPDYVVEESRERSGAGECGETWIQDRYELLGGNLDCFRGQQGTFDWAKLDNLNIGEKPYYLVFDYMYQKYMQSGNLESKINFGKMLSKLGCVKGKKRINGKVNVVYVGIRSSYKPEVVHDN